MESNSCIITPLRLCPFCSQSEVHLIETLKNGDFLYCFGCKKTIYEIEIKKRYCSPYGFQKSINIWDELIDKNKILRERFKEKLGGLQ
jgi:hypothetical protein